MYHCIFFYCFVCEVISKTRASGLITGSKHLETIKALVLRPRAFICFSVFGTPDKTLALVFDILLENLPIVAYHHPNNLSVIFVRAQLPGTHNCNNMPGPLPVLFSAIVVNAPHAPILTRVYIETAVSENFLSNSPSVSHMLLITIYSGLTQASIRGIAQMQSLPFR